MNAIIAAGAVAAIAYSAQAQSPADIAGGRALYEGKCGGCHSLDGNRIGPSHRGVVGRMPGAVKGYAYSKAVKRLGGIWSEVRLDRWLQDPQKHAPGSKMFLSVADAKQRRAIIIYLKSVSSRPPSGRKPPR